MHLSTVTVTTVLFSFARGADRELSLERLLSTVATSKEESVLSQLILYPKEFMGLLFRTRIGTILEILVLASPSLVL